MPVKAKNYKALTGQGQGEAKYYDLAELSDLQPKQHVINPDFQVNQRGQSEYNFSSNGKYGLDCWQHRQGNYTGALIVKPIKGGGVHIKLGAGSGGGLRQAFIDDSFEIGKPYTAVVSINNTRYTGTLNLSNVAQKYIENDLFQLEIGIIDGVVNYSLWIKQNGFEGDINYCDLFEGDIAYPHVKNKYEYDLEWCKKYILNLNDGESYTIAIKTSGSDTKFVVWNRFATSPNFVDKGIEYFNKNMSWVSGTISVLSYHRNYVDININTPDANDGGVLIRNLPILSCEPL